MLDEAEHMPTCERLSHEPPYHVETQEEYLAREAAEEQRQWEEEKRQSEASLDAMLREMAASAGASGDEDRAGEEETGG